MGHLDPTQESQAASEKKLEAYACELEQKLEARTRELSEGREQQAATAEVLQVISTSPTDVQSVFDVIVKSAVRLCSTLMSCVWRFDGKLIHLVAQHGLSPEGLKVYQRTYPLPLSQDKLLGQALVDRKPVNVADVLTAYRSSIGQRELGHRSVLAVPIIREGVAIGVIATSRKEPGLFPEKQVQLLETFADQAVIAIENVRLFDEVQARTRELSESLEQQTATSEVLRVISSSPGELQPVFNAMLENAVRLCEAKFGNLFLREGNAFRAVAVHGPSMTFVEWYRQEPLIQLSDISHTPLAHVAGSRRVLHIFDLRED